MPKEPFPFIYVRSDSLEDKELLKSPATFLTLCTISMFAKRKKDGSCYFKQETVARHLGKTRQAISQHLRSLEQLGYIEIIPQSYKGRQSNNAYKILYDTKLPSVQDRLAPLQGHAPHETLQNTEDIAPQGEVAPVQDELSPPLKDELAPKPVSYTKPIKKEKNALTREAFLRVINGGYQAGAFDDFDLPESIVAIEANNVWDHWAAKDEWPGGDPISIARNWIRNGLAKSKIKRQPIVHNACQEEQTERSSNPMQAWHERVRPLVGEAIFRSWIRPLHWDGAHTLGAPSRFVANWVNTHYKDQIISVIEGAEIIHKPYEPEGEKEPTPSPHHHTDHFQEAAL